MSEPLPHFFGDVWAERRKHYDQSFQSLTNYKNMGLCGRNRIGVEIAQLIEEFHQRGDASVEMQLVKVAGYLGNCLMRLSPERTSICTQIRDVCFARFVSQTFLPPPNHCVHTSQESDGAFDTAFRPAQLVFDLRSKQHKQAGSISAEGGDHFVRIDAVA